MSRRIHDPNPPSLAIEAEELDFSSDEDQPTRYLIEANVVADLEADAIDIHFGNKCLSFRDESALHIAALITGKISDKWQRTGDPSS